MAMGRDSEVQSDLIVTWAEIPRSPGHVFYDKLQKLLAEAGYPNGRDAQTGKPLVLNYDYFRVATPEKKAEMDWMVRQFAKLGVQGVDLPGQLGKRPFTLVAQPPRRGGRGLWARCCGDGRLVAPRCRRRRLARALLNRPQVLILDEASANLDEATELEIAASLRALRGRCTTILVSHRAGILTYADETVRLGSS